MTAVATKLMELETRASWLERVLAELKAEGLIRDLTPQERAAAAQWEALPEEEKEAVIQELRNLELEPMLSEIIIQNRR